MRATRGQSYASMRKQMVSPNRASGGSLSVTAPIGYVGGAAGSGGGGGPMTLEVSLNVGLASDSFVQVVSAMIRGNDGSREQLESLAKMLQNNGDNQFVGELAKLIKPKL